MRQNTGQSLSVKFKKTRMKTSDLALIGDTEFSLTQINGQIKWIWGNVKKKTQLEILRMLDDGVQQKDIAQIVAVDKGYVSRIKTQAIRDNLIGKNGKLTQTGFHLVYGDQKE